MRKYCWVSLQELETLCNAGPTPVATSLPGAGPIQSSQRLGVSDVTVLQGYRTGGGSGSGSGMNSLSPGTLSNRAAFQSALACSIRSIREETKFHQMWRGPSIGSPPSIMKRAAADAAVPPVRTPPP